MRPIDETSISGILNRRVMQAYHDPFWSYFAYFITTLLYQSTTVCYRIPGFSEKPGKVLDCRIVIGARLLCLLLL